MEIKKAPSADLEKGKGLSLLLGLVVALSFLFTALEWHSYATVEKVDRALNQADLEDVIAVEDEQQEEQKEPEQVQQQETQPEVSLPEDFKVVDNNTEVAKMNFQSSESEKPAPPPAPVGPATPVQEETDEIFVVVEEPTEFPGGPDALNSYLSKNIRYPEIAQENGIQGRVIVQFVVERDGSTAHIEVARGVDPALDKEAVRVVKEMPKWKPGKQRGKAVRTKYTLPVVFRLQ